MEETNIVEKLREKADLLRGGEQSSTETAKLLRSSADEIEKLRRVVSASLRIVCEETEILRWAYEPKTETRGYFVRIGEEWEFVGDDLREAVDRLAEATG